MAQIEVGEKAKDGIPTIVGHLEFEDSIYSKKTVSVEVKLKPHIFKSGKTGFMIYSDRVAVDADSNLNYRLFNGMLGVYDPTKEYTPREDTTPVKEE